MGADVVFQREMWSYRSVVAGIQTKIKRKGANYKACFSFVGSRGNCRLEFLSISCRIEGCLLDWFVKYLCRDLCDASMKRQRKKPLPRCLV